MKINFGFAKKLSIDFIYSIAGIMALNMTIQLAVYPMLEERMGAALFGNVLTLLSVVSIAASSFGSAASYSRMLASAHHATENGDYNRFLMWTSALSIVVGLVFLTVFDSFTPLIAIAFSALIFLSVVRYYSDVSFRMTLNYKRYFFYYVIISLGYLLGVLAFRNTNGWVCALITGELAGVIFVLFKSNLFKKPYFEKSEYYTQNIKALTALAMSNVLSSVVLNADRFLIRSMIGPEMVTMFYTATLIGKVISMLGTPLNGILIGYLTKYEGDITKKSMRLVAVACLGMVLVASLACWGVSLIFVRIIYPDVFEAARPLFFIGNAGQIFYFIANSVMVLVMRMCGERISLRISILHIAMFVLLVVPACALWGIWGIAYAFRMRAVGHMGNCLRVAWD